jgi:hypothetical protein
MTGGTVNHYAGAVTTATAEQGTLNYLSAGTITESEGRRWSGV